MVRVVRFWLLGLLPFHSGTAPLPAMGFTDESAFSDALEQAGLAVQRFDLEDTPAGTVLDDGDRLGPFVFGHAIAGGTIGLAVTSGSRFLGLSAGPVQDRQIQRGDRVLIRLLPVQDGHRPVRAFALKLVSGDPLLAGDSTLSAGGLTVGNATAPAGTTVDGGRIYFLGLLAHSPIDGARLGYGFPDDAVAFLFTGEAPGAPCPVGAAAPSRTNGGTGAS